MKVSPRVESLFVEEAAKEPSIPLNYGANSLVSEGEAFSARTLYKELKLEELVSLEMGLELDIVDKIVQGEIWPYAGGRLKRTPVVGPHPANSFTSNHARFIRGVTQIAVEGLSDDNLTIYCNMVGLDKPKAKRIRDKVEVRNDEQRYQRIRKVLLLVSEGKSTEDAARIV